MRLTALTTLARLVFVLAFSAIGLVAIPACARSSSEHGLEVIAFAELPAEAQQTVRLIRRGGPYPFERDGVVFGNYERLLPLRERGYYHEYTVPTPGVKSRGARRIIAGRVGELYYTGDHYKTFKRVRE